MMKADLIHYPWERNTLMNTFKQLIKIKNLRTKLFLIIIPTMVLTILFISVANMIAFRSLHSEYKRLVEDKSFTIAENIRQNANKNLEFLPFKNMPGMNVYLAGVLKHNPDYSYCFIADKEMNILYHNDETKMHTKLDEHLYDALQDNTDIPKLTLSVDKYYELIIPIIKSDEGLGTIHLGIEKMLIDAKILNVVVITIAALIISFGISVSVLYFFLQRNVIRPIMNLSGIAHKLADFDLTVSVDKTGRYDEIGRLLTAINKMVLEFRKIVSDVKSTGKQLADSSGRMTENISTVASSAEEISINVRSVSDTAEQMSQNVDAVASAIEEMSVSVNEVGKNAYKGSGISKEAVTMAEKAGETMLSLGEAASQIGEVTEVIKKIADKTNLLALNAHIEAASAGDAGKGFAVVANEIKEFARQSTHAAEDIAGRISAMQENTRDAVAVISDVSGIINSISHSSEIISAALEEQMKAANEISSNVTQANIRAIDIALSIEELAKGANEVSMRVGIAAGGVEDDTKKDGDAIDASAAEVLRLAKALLELMNKFKVKES